MNINVTLPENLRAANGEAAALQAASRELEEIAGQSMFPASAEWEPILDHRGNRHYVLKVSDFSGQVSEEFSAAQLHSPRRMRSRLLELWGDLLQIRSHTLLKRLTDPSAGG